MYVRVPNLLSEENLQVADELIAHGKFSDGAATTGAPTKAIKHNLQLDLGTHPRRDDFFRMITQVMNANPMVRSVALPKRMSVPLVSKYEPGMSYGWHIDNAIMSAMGNPMRSDIACTIFVSNKQDYSGGELMVRTASGDIKVKLDRGDGFLYPATSRHQVLEVTQGQRLAIVFWIQSMIEDVSKRELLHDLEMAYDRLTKENPKSEALQMIQRAQANLLRRWSDI